MSTDRQLAEPRGDDVSGLPEGPTVYGKLMTDATSEGIDALRSQIEARVAHTAGMLANDLAEIVRHAYVEGVRDGYVQGIAAGGPA